MTFDKDGNITSRFIPPKCGPDEWAVGVVEDLVSAGEMAEARRFMENLKSQAPANPKPGSAYTPEVFAAMEKLLESV